MLHTTTVTSTGLLHTKTQGGGVRNPVYFFKVAVNENGKDASSCHAGYLSLSVYSDGWFNLCPLMTQCATGVQPHLAPESNRTRPGEAA